MDAASWEECIHGNNLGQQWYCTYCLLRLPRILCSCVTLLFTTFATVPALTCERPLFLATLIAVCADAFAGLLRSVECWVRQNAPREMQLFETCFSSAGN